MSRSQSTGPSPSTQAQAQAQAHLDKVFEAINRGDAPGLVVGVAQHGKVLYRRGFGLASLEHGVANTPWTRMRIGSTSKHFTCLAALLLAEDGLLDVDASVRRYVPELPALKAEATVRQLMTHTSGYRDYLDIGFLADGLAIKPKGLALAAQVRQTEANFPPGELMMYNNGGYHLLSVIIDRVSGVGFEQFLKDRIFTPLGMVDTASVPSDFEIHPGMATMHVPLPEGGFRRGIFPTEEIRGEGAMVSTIDDMMLWLAHLRGPKRVGTEATWRQMLAPTRLDNGLVIPYALGLMCNTYRDLATVHHAGGVIGGSCQMLTVPSESLDIIIIANWTTGAPVELAHKVIDVLADSTRLGQTEAKATSERFGPVLGKRYHAPSGFLVGFVDADGKLGMAALNGPPVPLRDEGDSLRLGFEDMAAGPLVFDTAELTSNPAPSTLQISEAGNTQTFRLLADPGPELSAARTELVGDYSAPDLDTDARVEFEGESLVLNVRGMFGISKMVLEPYSADVYGWKINTPLLPLQGVLNVERQHGQVCGFRIDTLRTRHLLFSRQPDSQH